MRTVVSDQRPVVSEEAAGRACYEGFCHAMAEWIPETEIPDWTAMGETLRHAWIAAAKAAQTSGQ